MQEANMTEATIRKADLRRMLRERRREMQNDVNARIRDGRINRSIEVRDDLEHCDADSQGDIALALLQMRAEALARIDEALARLEADKYGSCFGCQTEISAPRLRALPFAVRCQACEEKREQEQGRARRLAGHSAGFSLFSNVGSS
jgi:RNA polymerase-binding transcription factor